MKIYLYVFIGLNITGEILTRLSAIMKKENTVPNIIGMFFKIAMAILAIVFVTKL